MESSSCDEDSDLLPLYLNINKTFITIVIAVLPLSF